jgi:Adenine specific DNA methylase Mod
MGEGEQDYKRVELVWPGKRTQVERVKLPFQVIERVNDVRRSERGQAPLLGTEMPLEWPDNWRNKLIWGDNKYVLASLLDEFAGKVDLIYIDPPFEIGADFSYRARLGDNNDGFEVVKEPTILEEKAYRDTWGDGVDSYLHMIHERLIMARDLLSPSGTIYLHLGPNIVHYVKALMDEVFGRGHFLNQIIWQRQTAHSDVGQGARHLGRLHDVLLLYTKGESYRWNMQYTEYTTEFSDSFYRHVEPETGRRFGLSDVTAPGGASKGNPHYEFLGVVRYWRFSKQRMQALYEEGRIIQSRSGTVPRQKRYLEEMKGIPLQDIWTDIRPVAAQGAERTGYDTQKPEALLERVIRLSSDPGDLTFDFFCGSGTTMVASEKLGRRWIGCDLGRFAIQTSRKRLCFPSATFGI